MAEAECCEALAIFLRADDTDPAITDNRRLLAAARNPSPTRRGGTGVPVKRSLDVSKLRKELTKAVESEDYERAAKLRDQIRQAEGG